MPEPSDSEPLSDNEAPDNEAPDDEAPEAVADTTEDVDGPEEARRTLERVAGQLEWVQERLDQLDATAAAAAQAMEQPSG
jgi:hypothetical protein